MSPCSWPLLDACTVIKDASFLFHLQIPQMPLQRLAGVKCIACTKSRPASQFIDDAAANVHITKQ